MPAFDLKWLMFTMVSMSRINVVTKEVMKDYYKGKSIFHAKNWDQMSVHDDLELFYEQSKSGPSIYPLSIYPLIYGIYPNTVTFCFPKLTDEELLLLKNKDVDYLKTYCDFHMGENPDVKEADMLKSKSKSKFAYCLCTRSSGYFFKNFPTIQ